MPTAQTPATTNQPLSAREHAATFVGRARTIAMAVVAIKAVQHCAQMLPQLSIKSNFSSRSSAHWALF